MSGPFDKARYAALLEGLEISEIRRSELERTLRFDSEFFLHRYREVQSRLACQKLKTIPELVHVSDGNHFSISDDFVDDGIPYYRGQDVVGHFFIEQSAPVHIPQPSFDRPYMMRSHLKKGDVLLSIVGTIGELSLVTQDRPATCSCKLAILRPRAKSISPEYLAVFLRSRYGRGQIERLTRGAIQMSFLLEDMDQAVIPRFSPAFEEAIDKTVRQSHVQLNDAEEKMHTAEQTLLAALNLADWHPPEPLTYTRSSDDVLGAERFDSEFFKPKFDELVLRIRSCGKCMPLGTLLTHNQRGKQPIYAETGLCVVNSKHVLKNEVLLGEDNDHAQSIPEVQQIHYGDVVINGTGVGTIGRAATFFHKTPAIPDNHVTILRLKDASIDPVFLSVYLNSIAGQIQVNKWLHGSSGQIELYPADIAQFQIWIAPSKVQRTIRDKIEGAFAARNSAKDLLARAQRAVEIAIEKNEASALRFLNEKGV